MSDELAALGIRALVRISANFTRSAHTDRQFQIQNLIGAKLSDI